jgi:hypothetical protein
MVDWQVYKENFKLENSRGFHLIKIQEHAQSIIQHVFGTWCLQ